MGFLLVRNDARYLEMMSYYKIMNRDLPVSFASLSQWDVEPTSLETDLDFQSPDSDADFTNTEKSLDDKICSAVLRGMDTSIRHLIDPGRFYKFVNDPSSKLNCIGCITCLPRWSDLLGGSLFMRMKINNSDHCNAILDQIQHMSITMSMGSSTITIPSLTINFLILEKLQEMGRDKIRGINTFNLREWLSLHKEDLESFMISKNNLTTKCMNRYFVCDMDDTYLDIPLLFDFFSYGIDISMVRLPGSNVRIKYIIPMKNLLCIQSMITGDLTLYPEYTGCYNTIEQRDDAVGEPDSYIIMKTTSSFHYANPSNTLVYTVRELSKFIFVLIKSTVADVSDLPEIINTDIFAAGVSIALDPCMFYVADYDKNMRLYVISPDPYQDMRNWVEVINEYKGHSAESYHNKMYDIIYPHVSIDSLRITLSSWEPYITVAVHIITQDILKMCDGVAIAAYS